MLLSRQDFERQIRICYTSHCQNINKMPQFIVIKYVDMARTNSDTISLNSMSEQLQRESLVSNKALEQQIMQHYSPCMDWVLKPSRQCVHKTYINTETAQQNMCKGHPAAFSYSFEWGKSKHDTTWNWLRRRRRSAFFYSFREITHRAARVTIAAPLTHYSPLKLEIVGNPSPDTQCWSSKISIIMTCESLTIFLQKRLRLRLLMTKCKYIASCL